MDPQATDLALQTQQKPDSIPPDTTLTDALKEAWKSRCSSLGEEEWKKFESYACSSLAEYLDKLEAACQKHREESYGFKVIEWFEPIFKAVELFTPAAAVAIQAYPNPGSLVLGGIVGVLQTTNRLLSYQKLTVQMLAKMGRKARKLLEYEKDVYRDDYPVQRALVQVYGDILVFCQKAFRFLTEDGQVRAKVKGLGLILIRDYESQLGKEVQDFEGHIEDLEERACLCDKMRLKELRDGQEAHHKEFGRLVADTQEYFRRHDGLLVNLLKREQDLRDQKERRKKGKEKERLLNWLSPLNFRGYYDERCDEHLEGTGSWFLDSDNYKKWKYSKGSDLLWVRGKPGCGKSVLAAVAITDLKLEMGPESALAYAFCRREDESSQNPVTIFGALVKQISQQHSDINSVLESEFLASQNGETPSKRTIRTVMISALSLFSRTFLVIDAFDECKDNNVLADDLLDLMQDKTIPPVKILVFSRHDFLLEECFSAYEQLKQIQPDLGGNKEDLKAYINSLFPNDSQISVNKEIREACIEKANGMFLWVKLLAKTLQKPLHSKQKLNRIRDIPPGLASMYNLILKDICDQDEDVKLTAFLVLMWVTHAKRPLTRFEMLEAVADYSEASKLEQSFKHTVPEHLVAICANLVYIDEDGYFRLCHESVRDHLKKVPSNMDQPLAKYQQQTQNANQRLAEICLNYLLLEDFECGPARSVGKLLLLVNKCQFLAYAAEFWGLHIPEETTPFLHDLILQFVLSPARRELSMQMFLFDPERRSDLWTYTGSSNPLHILSIFGLRQTAETLPDVATFLEEPDGSGRTPLIYALIGKRQEMSVWLIDTIFTKGKLSLDAAQKILAIQICATFGWADALRKLISAEEAFANSQLDGDGLTPLVRACCAGEREAAATLIDNKANVNLKDGSGDSPLIVSTVSNHTSLVELLLEKGADPNCRDNDGTTPLHYAAQFGNAAIAVALLNRNADPLATAPKADDQTPFHIAAENESVEVIKALHRVSPKLDMKSKQGCTALHIAAWHNSSKSARVLLELGVPKDEVDNNGDTALYIAAQEGALETVKVLVEARCDNSPAASNGKPAIYAAASSGKLSVMRCIMRSQPAENWKALVNKRNNADAPIHRAVAGGNAEMVKFLLDAGADGTMNGLLESSPLHYAAHYGHRAMSSLLLNHTREPNPRNQDGDTPLHFAARACKFGFILQFFEDCSQLGLSIAIDAQNNVKKSALKVALDNQFEEGAKLLLEKGSTSKPDLYGDYPIHTAAWHGFDSIVKLLLAQDGATVQGYFGRTPLSCAAARGQLKVVKLFAPRFDKILNTRDDKQSTPVLNALMNRHLEVTNYLLDIHADHSVVDEHGNSLLHIAAGIGDLLMVRRLLSLGCRGDAPDRYGGTPLHRAVESDSLEVVDEMTAASYKAFDVPDSIGNTCSYFAAQQGNLEMLQKLEAHGAPRGCRNLLGRSAAHTAASNGHYNILMFLKNCGESLDQSELEGTTPLINAAFEGYPETVKYLLQSQAYAVNDCSTWQRASPLSDAARHCNPLTVKYLLAAGADPHHRDTFGLNALDYAARHPVSLREMHKAGYFRNLDSRRVQEQTLSSTVRHCCETLLLIPQTPSVAELYNRLSRVLALRNALILLQDYSAAKICLMESLWPPKFSLLYPSFQCNICGSWNFPRDVYVCESCYLVAQLCEQCHHDYDSSGRGAPEALKEITNLEKQVQSVRVAMSEGWSLYTVSSLVNYFKAGTIWMSAIIDEYDAWEQKHNSNSKYRELKRPGQEFLNMVKTMNDWMKKVQHDDHIDSEDAKSIKKLSDEYQVHRRKYRADKEIVDFICKDHKYFVVSPEERDKVKSAGTELDPEFGRLTHSFLEELLNRYRRDRNSEAEGTGPISDEWPQVLSRRAIAASGAKSSNRDATNEKADELELLYPQSLKRSITTSNWEPATRHSGEDLGSASIADKIMPGRILFPESTVPNPPRRARTLPISMKEAKSLKTQSFSVEMKDTRVVADMQTRLDGKGEGSDLPIQNSSLPTVNKTVNVSLTTEHEVLGERPVNIVPSTEENDTTLESELVSPDSSILALTLGSEPESTIESQAEASGAPLTESNETPGAISAIGAATLKYNDEDASETLDFSLRTTYILWHGESETDENIATWMLALQVTESMVPGFIDAYFRIKKEERDRTEEE